MLLRSFFLVIFPAITLGIGEREAFLEVLSFFNVDVKSANSIRVLSINDFDFDFIYLHTEIIHVQLVYENEQKVI